MYKSNRSVEKLLVISRNTWNYITVRKHYYYCYYFTPFRAFQISVSRWFLTGVWVTVVSSSVQDSSQYFGRSQQCCSLDDLHLSCYFQVLHSQYKSFCDCTKSSHDNKYHHHFHIPQFFQFSSKVVVLIHHFDFFQYYFVIRWDSKVHNSASSLFLVDYYSSGWDQVCLKISLLLLLLFFGEFFTAAPAGGFHCCKIEG